MDGRINAAIESSSGSISRKYSVGGFGSEVDSAIRSGTAPNSEVSSVLGFHRAVENVIKSTTASNLETPVSVDSFGQMVENAMRSFAPNSPPLYGFAEVVNLAISSHVGFEEDQNETQESPSGTVYEGFPDMLERWLVNSIISVDVGLDLWRVVRCPKCRSLLQELALYSVYRCGGCGTVLRAKHKYYVSGSSADDGKVEIGGDTGKSESFVKSFVDRSDASDIDAKSSNGPLES